MAIENIREQETGMALKQAFCLDGLNAFCLNIPSSSLWVYMITIVKTFFLKLTSKTLYW